MKLKTGILLIALLANPLRAQNSQRYQGGNDDGYSLVRSANIFLDGSTLTARYQGGDGDGYDLLGSLNSFLDGGTLTARYQGGIGDGYALLASGSFSLIPGLVFSVERATGDVFAAGSFIPSGADLAERINVSEPVEAGDVVELDPTKPGHYRKSRGHSHLIAGVITTEPGFTLGIGGQNWIRAAPVLRIAAPCWRSWAGCR